MAGVGPREHMGHHIGTALELKIYNTAYYTHQIALKGLGYLQQ